MELFDKTWYVFYISGEVSVLAGAVDPVNLNIKSDDITGSVAIVASGLIFKFPSNDKIDSVRCPVPGVVSPVVS
jgi:hypothetical protein